jgi:hypothetical protein
MLSHDPQRQYTVFTLTCLLVVCSLALLTPPARSADVAGDKKRALLAQVKRLVVVPPFFGTDTLDKAAEADRAEKSGNADTGEATMQSSTQAKRTAESNARLKQVADQLRKLEAQMQTLLPLRVTARTPYTVVPADELAQALKQLDLTPAKLFQNNGRIRGGRMAAPNPEPVRKLAAALHADAVLLGTLDEPHRNNGGPDFDPLSGPGYESPHVLSKGSFYVLLADGTEVLHEVREAAQPLSRIGQQQFPLADWKEVQALLVENLLDEVTRYTPAKK